MNIPAAFGEVVRLALATGAKNIYELDGCWEYQVDEQWWVAVNGHDAPMKCSHGAEVPPYTLYVEFNGWPAGIVDAGGGTIAAGAAANEDTFIAAVEAAALAAKK